MPTVRPAALLAALALTSALVTPGTGGAAARCGKGTPVEVKTDVQSVGFGNVTCSFVVRCPATHAGKCEVDLVATITGTGLVSAYVRAPGTENATCLFVNECAAKTGRKLSPGSSLTVTCGNGTRFAAVQALLQCSGRAT